MSATARAEARRKAILSRGSDRLAKLTTSARGDDPAYMHDDPPVPTIPRPSQNSVGEESAMPTPSNHSSSSPHATAEPMNPFAAFGAGGMPDPSVWSEQQQQQLLQAIMMGNRSPESLPGLTPTDVDPSLPPMDNPFAAMLSGGGAFPPFPGVGVGGAAGKAPAAETPGPPTRLQRLMPFVHLVTMWCLLAYFVLYMEPKVHAEISENLDKLGAGGLWRRWAELGRASGLAEVALILRIQVLPFFWAFTTLQIVLHSVRIFSGFDAVQPPMLLAFALPHLPPPLPSIIVNGMKYLQMGSLFLDDLAGLLVGLGFIVLFSGWLTA
ncbi:hypothetical protein DXG01_004683 [Tephrocybe rancida]|nr:hypothetical protein DXG01_004683 [Tephrocybe rancida]